MGTGSGRKCSNIKTTVTCVKKHENIIQDFLPADVLSGFYTASALWAIGRGTIIRVLKSGKKHLKTLGITTEMTTLILISYLRCIVLWPPEWIQYDSFALLGLDILDGQPQTNLCSWIESLHPHPTPHKWSFQVRCVQSAFLNGHLEKCTTTRSTCNQSSTVWLDEEFHHQHARALCHQVCLLHLIMS